MTAKAYSRLLDSISETVAEAANEEKFDDLAQDISGMLKDALPLGEKEKALKASYVTCWMASFPGCLPGTTAFFPMSAPPSLIKDDILSWLEDAPEFEDDEDTWEEVKAKIDDLNLDGDSLSVPTGMVIEVFRLSCAEVLKNNGCFPYLEN